MIPVSLTLFAYVILKFVLLIGYVPSASMPPTLPERSLVIGCRWFEDLQVGDIIIFERDGVLMVKRIAAVPGERLDLRAEAADPDSKGTCIRYDLQGYRMPAMGFPGV